MGNPGLIPELGRYSGEGNGNPLQYSCLENSMDRGAWQATVHRIAKRHRAFEQLTFSLFKIQSHKDYKKSLADNDICHLLDRLPKSQGKRTADSLIQQLLAKHLLSACHWRTCLVVQWHSQCKRPGFDPWLGN